MDPTFFQMYGNHGGVNPSLFTRNVWEIGGVTPQNEACMSVRCGKCILCRGIEFENICCGGYNRQEPMDT